MKRFGSSGIPLFLVLTVGCLQMLGWALEIPSLTALGKASVASPLPLVFSSHDGLETFSQKFTLILHSPEGEATRIPLDAARYARLEGAYNRRNTWGAALSYGPILDSKNPKTLQAVLHYGLCSPGVLLQELGIEESVASMTLEARAAANPENPWLKKVTCP